jgi:hypothetical protein
LQLSQRVSPSDRALQPQSLLHLLTHSGYLNDKSLIVELIGNIETSLHVSHLDGSSGDTSIALSVVLLNINLLIMLLIRVKEGFLV